MKSILTLLLFISIVGCAWWYIDRDKEYYYWVDKQIEYSGKHLSLSDSFIKYFDSPLVRKKFLNEMSKYSDSTVYAFNKHHDIYLKKHNQ